MAANDANSLQWISTLFPRPQHVGSYHYGNVVYGHFSDVRIERELV